MDREAPVPEDLGPLRSQDTLEPLQVEGDAVRTASGSRTYPVREGLIFMGYPARDEAMIAETMAEERDHQASPALVAGDEAFAAISAPHAVDLVNVVRRLTGRRPGLRSAELGSGSGWVSWLMAEAGFDTWIVDFEPNSLFSGWIYEHPNLGPGRRIVGDGRYAPFADGSFDVVLMKEFAHHVEDAGGLFAEANRILRPGGLIALMDPTTSVWHRIWALRHPDTHKGHHITWADRYLWMLRRAGFRRRWLSYAFHDERRLPVVRHMQAHATRSVAGMRQPRSPLTHLHARLLGGASLVYVGEKVRDAPPVPRPEFRQIDPGALRLEPADIQAWAGCRRIVGGAAEQLV